VDYPDSYIAGFLPRPTPPLIHVLYDVYNWQAALETLTTEQIQAEHVASQYGWLRLGPDVGATVGSDRITRILNRAPEEGESPFPTHAQLRADRYFEGAIRIARVSYLDEVEDPGDLTDAELADDKHKSIVVRIPSSGPLVVPRTDIPTLLRARALGRFEIAVRPFYV
jgi:hypothetical protein